MRLRGWMLTSLFALLVGAGLAQDEGDRLNLQGEINTRVQIRIAGRDSSRVTWFRSAASVDVTPIARERIVSKVGITVRTEGLPRPANWADLNQITKLEPVALSLDEAFVRFYDILPALSITLGRQKVHWGTADVVNPTDNFTTPDYSDPLVWDERRPVWMVHMGWEPIPALGGELVVKPIFAPALPAPGEWFTTKVLPDEEELRSFLVGEFIRQGLDSITAREMAALYDISRQEEMTLPGRDIRDVTWGGRLKSHIGVFDFSLSYLQGFDFLPTAEPVITVDPVRQHLDFVLKERFLSKRVIGADAAANIAGLGMWVEAGYSLYSDTLGKDGIAVVGGFDYSWSGFYTNLQFLYGNFPLAQLESKRGGFILGAIERRFLSDRLLARVGGVVDVSKRSFGLMPLLRLSPADGVEIELGGLFFSGVAGSAFGRLNSIREVFSGVRYRF